MKPVKKKKATALEPLRGLPSASVSAPSRWPAWLLTAGAAILILHGIVELLPLLAVFFPAADQAPEFIFPELAANWRMTLGFSIVCGLLRIAAAVGILKSLRWGWILGILLSVITFAVLTFYLPAGVMDAVLAGPVLLLLLIGRYPDAKISG